MVTTVVPGAQELAKTQRAIESYLEKVRSHPEQRPGAHPYYQFHPAGKPIQGTVMMFHGFSVRPHQMWRLADYLYNNGFNVYQLTLAGHARLNPAEHWPQIDLRAQYVAPLLAKVQQDPVLRAAMLQKKNVGDVAPGQQAALLQRLLQVAPELNEFATVIAQPEHPDFDKYFLSSHQALLTNAQQRLAELSAMPGPIYTVGLSVGGAVALRLAASAPTRIKKTVAYAPLLKIQGEGRRRYVQLAGPLDISETGWDPNLRFPVGALTAADYFGQEVCSAKTLASLKQTPVFMTVTENEDSADVEASEMFFAALDSQRQGQSQDQSQRNYLYKYPAAAMVPHPMIDPTEVSQGMSNLFWQSLYQETLRFLTAGTVEVGNLKTLAQAADVAMVPSL